MYLPSDSTFMLADLETCFTRDLRMYASQFETLITAIDKYESPAGMDVEIEEALDAVRHELGRRLMEQSFWSKADFS